MSGFNKLSESFDNAKTESDNESPKAKGLKAVKQSIAIVKAIDKLKRQGVAVTKKAELDYLLALRVLERANVNPYDVVETEEANEENMKRNPADHPKEFQAAMAYSKKIVVEAEEMLKLGQTLTDKKLAEYELCKKFLVKYT